MDTFIFFLTFLLFVGCTSDKPKLIMEAYRSEGLTTSQIEFYDDSSYVIKESTFLDVTTVEGRYSIKNHFVRLNNIAEQSFIKSKELLLKKEQNGNVTLYQLTPALDVDTTFYAFAVSLVVKNPLSVK